MSRQRKDHNPETYIYCHRGFNDIARRKCCELRLEAGDTVEDAAKRMHISIEQIQNIENGVAQPDVDYIMAHAYAYYTSVQYICGQSKKRFNRTLHPETYHSGKGVYNEKNKW